MKKMNILYFDTIVHRDAYRSGFDVCKMESDYVAMLSSTAHKGKVKVEWDDEEKLFYIYDISNGVEFIKMTDHGMSGVLHDLGKFFFNKK